jgi:phosphoribosyl 1,2-cyclic phosphodiesterase
MEIRFWGCRGSLPASMDHAMVRRKVRRALELSMEHGLSPKDDLDAFIDERLPFWVRGSYGVNTSCVEVAGGDEILVCDAGSGLRDLGRDLFRRGVLPDTIHILLSHPHWDHIQGFPFFGPAFMPGARIVIHGGHPELESVFHMQQRAPCFPVDFSRLAADIVFEPLRPDVKQEIAGFQVLPRRQPHPGGSFGFRIEGHGKAFVYSTDAEHKWDTDIPSSPFLDFFRDADLVVFDAQYTYADACSTKEDWGHSNNIVGVELAKRAKVKHLCLFHQEPTLPDEELDKFLEDTLRYATLFEEDPSPLQVSIAYDGMRVEL